MSSKVNITIDGEQYQVPAGEKLLWAALDCGIYIPHLCSIREKERSDASCRLCFVEIEGMSDPVTSCTQEVREGMVVKTRTPRVDRLVKTAFELLLSNHKGFQKTVQCSFNIGQFIETITFTRKCSSMTRRNLQNPFETKTGLFVITTPHKLFTLQIPVCFQVT